MSARRAHELLFVSTHPDNAAHHRRMADFRAAGLDVGESVHGVRRRLGGYLDRAFGYAGMLARLSGEARRARVVWTWGPDVSILAALALTLNRRATLVWDITDLTPLQLRADALAKFTHLIEARAARRADHLVITSPRFYESYFFRLFPDTHVHLIENKVTPHPALNSLGYASAGPPWRLAYAGLFRSNAVARALLELCERGEGRVRVRLAGKTTAEVDAALFARLRSHPHVEDFGPYRDPEDLGVIYGDAHFTVGLVGAEENVNETLLLPNRLYHAGVARAPLLATAGSYCAEVAVTRGLGPAVQTDGSKLSAFFAALTPDAYETMRRAMPAPAQSLHDGEFGKLARDLLNAGVSARRG